MEEQSRWSDTQKIIALTVVFSFIGVVVVWMFYPPKGDPGAIAVLNTLVGSLGTGFGMVLTYFFGSSKTSSSKDATIARLTGSEGETKVTREVTVTGDVNVDTQNTNIQEKPNVEK